MYEHVRISCGGAAPPCIQTCVQKIRGRSLTAQSETAAARPFVGRGRGGGRAAFAEADYEVVGYVTKMRHVPTYCSFFYCLLCMTRRGVCEKWCQQPRAALACVVSHEYSGAMLHVLLWVGGYNSDTENRYRVGKSGAAPLSWGSRTIEFFGYPLAKNGRG